MTSEEVIQLFHPSEDSVSAVRTWLSDSGISTSRVTHTDNKAWLAFQATVDEAESLLHTTFFDYEHSVNGDVAMGCEE
jgi:tripeptidyl-peptidase I